MPLSCAPTNHISAFQGACRVFSPVASSAGRFRTEIKDSAMAETMNSNNKTFFSCTTTTKPDAAVTNHAADDHA